MKAQIHRLHLWSKKHFNTCTNVFFQLLLEPSLVVQPASVVRCVTPRMILSVILLVVVLLGSFWEPKVSSSDKVL